MRTHRMLGVTVVALVMVAACTAPPTTGADSTTPAEDDTAATQAATPTGTATGAEPDDAGEDPYTAVVAELEGLEGQERTDRLVELAAEEDVLNIYTSNTDLADMSEVFAETYGLEEPSVYRAQSHLVLQRLVEEDAAGFRGADFVDTNADELVSLNGEGLLRDYEGLGPAEDGIADVGLQDGWTGSRVNTFIVAWNTNLVTEPPTSFEDLADPRFEGLLLIEERASEWYMALTDYWLAEGRSQEEIDQLFADIVANATRVRGHTIQTGFLASGEFGASTNVYNHLVDEEIAAGAPMTWDTPIEPIVLRPNGISLLRTAQNPASALLLFEWLLGPDAQSLLLDEFRIPILEELQPDTISGLATAPVNVEKLAAEGPDWEEAYLALLDGLATAED